MGDAAPRVRVKERKVSIEVLATAHREISVGDDGEPVYGAITKLGGVLVCVTQRRDAFALFQPFEELADPLCATSEEGLVVRVENVPARSDLVLTVTKDGYVPRAFTLRTEDHDVVVPAWGGNMFTTLSRASDWEPWNEPAPAGLEDAGLVALDAYMVWFGPSGGEGVLGPEQVELPWGSLPTVYWAGGANARVEPQGAGEAIELRTLARRPRFLWLRPGSYRVTLDHPNVAPCQVSGVESRWPTLGLPVDAPEALELPVLAGHLQFAHFNCPCEPPAGSEQKLLDITTCTFEGADAGH